MIGMVRALRAMGCEAEIACTDDDGPRRLDVPHDGPTEFDGVPVRFFARFSPPVRALREFQFSSALGRWLCGNIPSYDLVHVHAAFSYASTRAMGIARRCGKPYILRPIGQLSAWSLGQKAAKKRLYLALAERGNIRGASGIHCTSEAERRDVLAFDGSLPAFVSPIGMVAPAAVADARARLRKRFGVSGDAPVVLFLGRLHPKKGIEVLIDACARFGEAGIALVVAGSGDPAYEASLRDLAARLRVRAHFAGLVSGGDKDALLQGADIFALPSQHENFGIAVLEALMSGLRVVVAPGVALAEFVEAHGVGRVAGPTVDALADALRSMLTAGPVPDGETRRIRQVTVDAFAWDHIARGLVSVYGRILGA